MRVMTFLSTVTVERVSLSLSLFIMTVGLIGPAGSHLSLYHRPKCSVHSQRFVLLSSRTLKVATIGTEGELGRLSVRP